MTFATRRRHRWVLSSLVALCACPVLVAPDEAVKRSRLALSAAALRQLEIALNLLGIDTPERM